ncbi:unnamed protein product [Echinostoma caproni]|uniref:Par3_HAL_N_term domain-containing protein n=1 Tax=Echinostoma caproni TaxID=27848 RepID=A0A183AB98_9TREM|nr:unnamed protein product [Echinostoma caproni]
MSHNKSYHDWGSKSTIKTRTPDKQGTTSSAIGKPVENQSGSKSPGQQRVGSRSNCSGEGCAYEVEALTLARDGGILDWDDRVVDVLDDRELEIQKPTGTIEIKISALHRTIGDMGAECGGLCYSVYNGERLHLSVQIVTKCALL